MPAEVERKIMKHGSSGVIAIPMSYRKYYNLNPGSKVKILFDSLLLIIPEGMETIMKEKQAVIDQLLGNRGASK